MRASTSENSFTSQQGLRSKRLGEVSGALYSGPMALCGKTRITGERGCVASLLLLLGIASVSWAQAPSSADHIISELRANHAEEALHDVEKGLRTDPQDVRLWILKGVAANQLQQPAVALASFEAALRLAPNSLPALEGAAEVAFRTDRRKAPDLVRRVLLQRPDDPNANGMAAMLEVNQKEWAAALGHFNKAGEAIATQEVALEAELAAFDHLGRDAEAEAIAQRVANMWPEDGTARYNLAVLQARQEQFKEALVSLQPLIAAHDEPALALAATASEALGDTPQAVELLREAIQQRPTDPQNYLDFAGISFDHNSLPAGIAMLNAGLTQIPNSAALHIARGALYMQSEKLDLAERDFATANQLDPTQSFGREAQGLTEIQRHDLPAALAKVKASLAADPRSAYLNYLAAEILKEQGATANSAQGPEAMRFAEHAVELDSKLAPALDLLCGFEFQATHLEQAAGHCRAALEQNPVDQEALYRLILTLRRTGGKDKEVAELVEKLKAARAEEQSAQVRVGKYQLSEVPAKP